MQREDLSKGLISEKDVRENLIAFFPDSIILKNNLTILAISNRVSDILNCKSERLVGQSFQKLTHEPDLNSILIKELSQGFFNNLTISLKGKDNSVVPCKISGFYLGLISDINDLAILKVEPFDEARLISRQLDACREELDEFVYRSTHDLRGPLATMRGIINLMKMSTEPVPSDIQSFIMLLDTYAKTLDDRLFTLNYLSETSVLTENNDTLDCQDLESNLRTTLEQNLVVKDLEFNFITDQQRFDGISENPVKAMLNQLLMYFINMPRTEDAKLVISVEAKGKGFEATIYGEGFSGDYQLRNAMQNKDPMYTSVINNPNMVNFFAAIKSSHRLKANIRIDFIYETCQQLTIVVPGRD